MINFNGDLLPDSSHFLNHTNRGLRYGDALFETLRYNGKQLFFWEDHYFRLMASMRQLRMEIPMMFNMEFAEAEILKTLEAGGRNGQPARVRITVFRDAGGRYGPDRLDIGYIIESEPLESPGYKLSEAPCRADLFRDYYVPADSLSGIKHTNRLVQVLGSIYAAENGLDTCLLLNQNKEVAGALSGNLFIRSGDQIRTPPSGSGCLEGIIRKQLLKIVPGSGRYSLEEAAISPFDLQKADELFFTNAIVGIRSVTSYRKAEFQSDAARFLTGKLNLAAVGAGV
ncbi:MULTISPECIES: aminotransferase class IV [Robiginitalea]|uniref:branched-chain-amino-acid transaminase n=1 Tax=Robiginitalea biformata (strain ATCC BAA-864 / DSM 15991 / KCTC 12146 / HTCC2501) TaxID=313596 RepID=A4CKH4_ROBBH|nr:MULTISPECIES: aminotransferase class IV [Robiginitalea]EAR15373.1 4-amino-4-deoxychorismate lyase, putative [Robiginitalea biformata HTCC2501]MDC6353868.1 aminotransferase class IV [Robiginitalea sp. PM2]MDC6374135.1 aminotransferase class IV [Robiginitalea sp. SP8]